MKTALTAPASLALTIGNDEPRIDSRMLARNLGIQHESVIKLLTAYRADFEELGKVRFEIGASTDSRTGQSVKFALLTEDQSYLLLTYSRNTARVRQLKVNLVKAFREARRVADLRKTEYLPEYHRLHDSLNCLATGSPHAKFVHMNVNKLLNKFAGIEAGQRRSAAGPTQSLLSVGCAVASRALLGASDHHDGYQRVKRPMLALSSVAMLESAK